MKTAVLVGVCGLFILFGISAGVDSVGEVRAGLRSLDWPIAQGEIIRSEPHNRIKRFEYRYTVVGQEFTSARAAFVRVPYFRSLHRVYRPGQAVAVRYDSANLGEAVLEPGAPMLGILAEALVALLLFGVGGVGLYYGLIRR